MKYRVLDAFRNDFRRLPIEHQRLFQSAVREYFLPAIDEGAFAGSPPWPKRLRIHRLNNTEIYSLTWNFAAPDGRATFHLDKIGDGDPVLIWRRVGNHGIYRQP
ncbi:hypothetical protein [Nocardia lasii]|uniref:Type II toxin-antitoxin system RelE/ParE family toxin n=1 Tax=Nocardia lasii TaxID=1616107 RepID=A0ABW1JQT9_9NOCA